MKTIEPFSMNSQKILITGGCGFIGVNLVNYLLRKGANYIKVLDNLSAGTRENLEEILRERGDVDSEVKGNDITYRLRGSPRRRSQPEAKVHLIIGDIRSRSICQRATGNVQAVIHLAAHAGVIPSIQDPFLDCTVNIHGTLNLLHSSVKNDVGMFLFASSNAAVGSQTPPMDEHKVPKPLSPYGASKLACEGYCSAFYRSYGLKTAALRLSNVYGPYSLHKKSVVAKFMKDGLSKGELTIYGDGRQTRDFIYIYDICSAICDLLSIAPCSKGSHPVAEELWGSPLQLGTGVETSISTLAEIVRGLFPQKIRISFVRRKKGEMQRNVADITKARTLIGFSPHISLEEGTRAVYRWYTGTGSTAVPESKIGHVEK